MLFPEQQREAVKRRLRETREKKWNMSQAEMAEFLRGRLDPEEKTYPSERTYVRWESLNSNELPQSRQKLAAVANVMDFDLAEFVAAEDSDTAVGQFLVVRRLDRLIELAEETNSLLRERRDLLQQMVGEDAAPLPPSLNG